MINKKVNNVHEALSGIENGNTIMLGGFGLCGIFIQNIKNIKIVLFNENPE